MPALGFSIAPGVKLSRTRQSQEEHGMYFIYFNEKRGCVFYHNTSNYFKVCNECTTIVRGQYEWDCE